QKSQNGGSSIPNAGQMMSGYHRYGSVIPVQGKEKGFFDGIDTSLAGIAELAGSGDAAFLKTGLSGINGAVEEAITKFSAVHPEATAPALARGLKGTATLIDAVGKSSLSDDAKYNVRHELEIKRVQFNDALAEALGLSLAANIAPETESTSPFAAMMGEPESFHIAIPGQKFSVKVHVVNQSPVPVTLRSANVEPYLQKETWTIAATTPVPTGPIADAKAVDARFSVTVPANAAWTRPYFSRPDIEQPYYTIDDDRFLNRPVTPYPLAAWADFEFEGAPIRIGQYVQTIKRVTGAGTVKEPLSVGPAIGVAIAPRSGIVPLGSRSFTVTAVVHSNVTGPARGNVKLDLPSGWKAQPASVEFATTDEGQDQSVTFEVTPAALAEKPYQIVAVAEYNGQRYTEGYQVTGYAGLRPSLLYKPATYGLAGVDVKIAPDLKVAYIMGSGDEVPAALEHLGVKVSFLGPSDLATGDLSKFDVILLGVRTYAAREDLKTHNSRILEYAKNGGVVIVQYNTPEFDHNYGPYPYVMGNNPEEVTDEASKDEILTTNPVFDWPNKIGNKDFTGWVEERGSKWMKSWDPQYQALLETHDEGQEPQKGGLLYAKYGKGIYMYNAWAFYRQLPEGVPGAYRLFANMLSLAKNPQR
ncbi:MAG TPA: NEW3 domain-containing protein, partial [Bryobacteraceae bacterium]|nr:NEW3 domain-containing protein [Bryobacteraceae bacterium]